MLEVSVELGYLRKAYQIQKDYIEGKIDKETFEKQDVSKAEALEYFKKKGDPYKCELIEALEDGTITFF